VVLLVGTWCRGQWWLGQGETQGLMQAGGDVGYLGVGSVVAKHGRVLGYQGLIHQPLKKSLAANLPLKHIQIDQKKVGVQCGLLQTLEGCIGIVMVVVGSWEVQEILPEATTDLFNECIKVYATVS